MGRHSTLLAALALVLAGCAGSASPTVSPIPAAPTPAPPAATEAAGVTSMPAMPAPTPALGEVVDIPYQKSLMSASAGGVEPGTEIKLDVYAPSGGGPWPVVIWAPGGEETKAAGIPFGRLMASKGAVVFVIDTAHSLDLVPQPLGTASRTFVEQAACAVRTARALAPEYGGDPGRIAWTGYSLGGVFGSELAFADPDVERLWADYVAKHGGPEATIECLTEGGTPTIDALVIASSGRYADIVPTAYDADPALRDFTASASRIGNNPALKVGHVHGTADPDVPFALAETLDRELRAAGYDAGLVPVAGGGHEHFDAELADLVLEVLGS